MNLKQTTVILDEDDDFDEPNIPSGFIQTSSRSNPTYQNPLSPKVPNLPNLFSYATPSLPKQPKRDPSPPKLLKEQPEQISLGYSDNPFLKKEDQDRLNSYNDQNVQQDDILSITTPSISNLNSLLFDHTPAPTAIKKSKIKIITKCQYQAEQGKKNSILNDSAWKHTPDVLLPQIDLSAILNCEKTHRTSQMRPKNNKFKSMIEVKPPPKSAKFYENKQWIRQLTNKLLNWQNSKNAPLEIKIMLKQLSIQASDETVSSLHNIQPISKPLPLSSRFADYDLKMVQQLKRLAKQLPVYRKIRGDGNCFYRAFNFSFLEMALTHSSSLYFLKFLSVIANVAKVTFQTDTQNTLIKQNPNLSPSKMRAFVLHRLLLLYSYRVTLAESNDTDWQQKIVNFLFQVFNQRPFCFDTFLIIGIKNYIASELQSKQEFKDFEESNQIINQILKYGQECELNQYPIRALSEGLNVCVSLFQQIRGVCSFESYSERTMQKVILYYRTGHYDIIYPYKQIYADIIKQRKTQQYY